MLLLGLRFKCFFVSVLCRTALPFLRDPERIEAVLSIRRNYDDLLAGGK
jgi:hypothetical protein